jgi:transcriptional coactivator p15 (PC4)
MITEQLPSTVVYRWKRTVREDVIASIGEFRGQRLADLRCHVADNGKDIPTKKGISVRVEDLPKLREAVEALIAAENSRMLVSGHSRGSALGRPA